MGIKNRQRARQIQFQKIKRLQYVYSANLIRMSLRLALDLEILRGRGDKYADDGVAAFLGSWHILNYSMR